MQAFRNNQIQQLTIPTELWSIGQDAFIGNSITEIDVMGHRTRFNSNWTSIGFPSNLLPTKIIFDSSEDIINNKLVFVQQEFVSFTFEGDDYVTLVTDFSFPDGSYYPFLLRNVQSSIKSIYLAYPSNTALSDLQKVRFRISLWHNDSLANNREFINSYEGLFENNRLDHRIEIAGLMVTKTYYMLIEFESSSNNFRFQD
jgi:hypothetical protein